MSQIGGVYASHFVKETWASMEQSKISDSYNSHCPSPIGQTVSYECKIIGVISSGEKVYWPDYLGYGDVTPITIQKGDTLIVLKKVDYSGFSPDEQKEVIKILDSLVEFSEEKFIEQYDFVN